MQRLESLADEDPGVQWAMNFAAGQTGIREQECRSRCIALGERLGLYKDEPFSRGCTPNYLLEFIRIEVEKLEGGSVRLWGGGGGGETADGRRWTLMLGF